MLRPLQNNENCSNVFIIVLLLLQFNDYHPKLIHSVITVITVHIQCDLNSNFTNIFILMKQLKLNKDIFIYKTHLNVSHSIR